jgi:hypothetical protein
MEPTGHGQQPGGLQLRLDHEMPAGVAKLPGGNGPGGGTSASGAAGFP